MLEKRAETLIFRKKSATLRTLPPSIFQNQDGIYWSTGRFASSARFKCEDVDMDLTFYYDSQIALVIPVVRDSSKLFHAYTMHVHLKIRPHSGVETSMKEINRKMFLLGNPRRVVTGVRKDCSKC